MAYIAIQYFVDACIGRPALYSLVRKMLPLLMKRVKIMPMPDKNDAVRAFADLQSAYRCNDAST